MAGMGRCSSHLLMLSIRQRPLHPPPPPFETITYPRCHCNTLAPAIPAKLTPPSHPSSPPRLNVFKTPARIQTRTLDFELHFLSPEGKAGRLLDGFKTSSFLSRDKEVETVCSLLMVKFKQEEKPRRIMRSGGKVHIKQLLLSPDISEWRK